MEPISFAFGAASLLSLYTTCLEGYTAIRTAKNLGKDTNTLLCQLEIEEARFMTWGRSVGLLNGQAASVINIDLEHANAVVKTLGEISSIISDTRKLQGRYRIAIEYSETPSKSTALVETSDAPFTDGVRGLRDRLLQEERRRSEFASSVQRGTSLLKKLRWVFTDKETLTSLISTLRGYNESLESMLNSNTRRQFLQDFQAFCLESSKTNDLHKLQTIEGAANQQCKQLALPAGHKIMRLRLELEYAERFDNHSVSTGQHQLSQTSELSSLELPWSAVYIEHPSDTRSLGLYKSKQILIEWRDLGGRSVNEADAKVIQRLDLFSRLLHESTPRPPEFRALTCLGYLLREAPARFAFVFDLSNLQTLSSSLSGAPSSLHDILSDDARGRGRPSQTARFSLARRLTSSVLYLHSTGWLHKGVRSQNILFLSDGDRTSAASISRLVEEPYLVGHGYARLSNNFAGSEPVDNDPLNSQYRHPDVLGEHRTRFQKKYDVYSLGVVLAEIAYWKPLSKLLSTRRTPLENSRKLMELVTSGDIAHWMGSIYSEAVESCLSCEWMEEDLELEFFEKVVKKLDLCVV